MVTGPRQYAGRLAAPLAAAGARVVAMPCIAIQRLQEAEQLQVRLACSSVRHMPKLYPVVPLGTLGWSMYTVEGHGQAAE
jgi:hypothetical protein